LVRRLEELYQQMWRQFAGGDLPRPDLRNLEAYLEVGNEVNHDEVEVQAIHDYHTWWRDRLARRHRFRPIPRDDRLLRPAE
jgi:hypothetical protein